MYDLAVQWRALARRQEARQAAYTEAMERPEAAEEDREAIDGLIEQLGAAEGPEVSHLEGIVTDPDGSTLATENTVLLTDDSAVRRWVYKISKESIFLQVPSGV